MLPSILARSGRLPVRAAGDGEAITAGCVYVAPPDHHLIVEGAKLRLTKTPRENGHRPAIDPTMRSAARALAGSTVGVILSGSRDDGTMGLVAIKQAGGLAVVQEPEEALYPSMPRSAIEHVDVDAVLPLHRIGDWVVAQHRHAAPKERKPMTERHDESDGPRPPGSGTRFTCPDCGGVLFERDDSDLERFQCSVGHVYGIESLVQAQGAALEHALWAAVRSLEDRAVLLGRMAERAARAPGRSAPGAPSPRSHVTRRGARTSSREAIEQARAVAADEAPAARHVGSGA